MKQNIFTLHKQINTIQVTWTHCENYLYQSFLKINFIRYDLIFSYREILTGLPRALERVPILNIWIVMCVVGVLSTKVCATLQNCLMFVIVVQFNVMQDRWLSDMRQFQTLTPQCRHERNLSRNKYLSQDKVRQDVLAQLAEQVNERRQVSWWKLSGRGRSRSRRA